MDARSAWTKLLIVPEAVPPEAAAVAEATVSTVEVTAASQVRIKHMSTLPHANSL